MHLKVGGAFGQYKERFRTLDFQAAALGQYITDADQPPANDPIDWNALAHSINQMSVSHNDSKSKGFFEYDDESDKSPFHRRYSQPSDPVDFRSAGFDKGPAPRSARKEPVRRSSRDIPLEPLHLECASKDQSKLGQFARGISSSPALTQVWCTEPEAVKLEKQIQDMAAHIHTLYPDLQVDQVFLSNFFE